jgi:glycosyltransferase involved in cell wall biosynthesis
LALITAIIPVFNRASTVGRAIRSVLAQKLSAPDTVAITVVDDGSSDELTSILRDFGNTITQIHHARNLGAAAARNTGISSAHSGYIAFLDSDDVWTEGKLRRQLTIMRERGWRASSTAYVLARSNGSEIVSPLYQTSDLGLVDVAWGCFVSPGSTLVCERALFDDIGLLDTNLQRLEDWDWLLRYARKYPLGFVAEPLARIEPSLGADSAKVVAALKIIRVKHMDGLQGRCRRYFKAGLDFELAAALGRRGSPRAIIALLSSLLRSPIRHDAFAAVLHNWS